MHWPNFVFTVSNTHWHQPKKGNAKEERYNDKICCCKKHHAVHLFTHQAVFQTILGLNWMAKAAEEKWGMGIYLTGMASEGINLIKIPWVPPICGPGHLQSAASWRGYENELQSSCYNKLLNLFYFLRRKCLDCLAIIST